MLADQLTLAGQALKALAAIGADAASGAGGHSLPLSPGALADPACLERILRAGREAPSKPLPQPRSVVRTAIEAPSSNCQNSVLEIEWAEGAAGAPAPPRLFVKQPCADLPTRLFANVIGFWKIECAFCRNLAREAPIDMPRIYAVAERGSRFVLVMDDLQGRPDTRLFVNRDLLEGADPDRARRCLHTLARLHAGFAGRSAAERERGLPIDLHPFLSPSRAPVMLAINRLAVARCQARAPDTFGDEAVALYRRALARWPALTRIWYREPLTLVHGDSHLGNFFESGGEMGMIDFQGAHWSQGIRDVQYFLIHSMRPDRLAEHERALVAGYAEAVTQLGAPLAFEEAWEAYRGFSFQALMTAVVSLGLGSFTDSDAVIRAMLERSVAAIERLDFASWLDENTRDGPAG